MRQQPLLIAGETFGASPASQPPRSSRLLRIVVIAWLLGGLAFLLVRFGFGAHEPARPATQQAKPPVPIASEDLLHHLDAFNDEVATAAAKLRRTEDHIASLPGVQRNFLLVEKNHLENALAITEAARRDLEQSRRDFEIVLNSLKKEHLSQ